MTRRVRAVAVLVRGKEILLVHRTREGKEFWVLPGGGVEENKIDIIKIRTF